MNILTWKVSVNNEVVAQVLSFTAGLETPRSVAKTLAGSVHIQFIGESRKYAEVSMFSTLEEKLRFEVLEAMGYEISVVYRGVKYTGYFEQALAFSPVQPNEYFASSGKLLIISEEVLEDAGTD